jgi:coproporphyrinogen III oxidase
MHLHISTHSYKFIYIHHTLISTLQKTKEAFGMAWCHFRNCFSTSPTKHVPIKLLQVELLHQMDVLWRGGGLDATNEYHM